MQFTKSGHICPYTISFAWWDIVRCRGQLAQLNWRCDFMNVLQFKRALKYLNNCADKAHSSYFGATLRQFLPLWQLWDGFFWHVQDKFEITWTFWDHMVTSLSDYWRNGPLSYREHVAFFVHCDINIFQNWKDNLYFRSMFGKVVMRVTVLTSFFLLVLINAIPSGWSNIHT